MWDVPVNGGANALAKLIGHVVTDFVAQHDLRGCPPAQAELVDCRQMNRAACLPSDQTHASGAYLEKAFLASA
jgi:hypothetical protein